MLYRAGSGSEALEILEMHMVDLIITDQRIQGCLALTCFLRPKYPKSEPQLNILLTGYTDTEDLISCINDGLLYRYLVKRHPNELLTTVGQALDKIKTERMLSEQTIQLRDEVEQRKELETLK